MLAPPLLPLRFFSYRVLRGGCLIAHSLFPLSLSRSLATVDSYLHLATASHHAAPHPVEEERRDLITENILVALSLFLSFSFRSFAPSCYRIMNAMKRMQEQQLHSSLILNIRVKRMNERSVKKEEALILLIFINPNFKIQNLQKPYRDGPSSNNPRSLFHCYPSFLTSSNYPPRDARQLEILLEGAGRYFLPGSSLLPID